ncbi:MAG TPA: 50S ribosomal protein L13 [Candidatus Bathyarchaeota archaeon]|nr:50S ribosomal protein L13 [Candidatus Bathyarchaeota archaeon]
MCAEGERTIYVDAKNHVLGRLSSHVAKLLLEGWRVIIVNAEKTVITGKKRSVKDDWQIFWGVRSRVHPRHTPRHYVRPDRVLKDVIKGMLPRKKPRGRDALHRLRVYIGVPDDYKSVRYEKFEDAMLRPGTRKHILLEDICREFGWGGS